MDNETIDELASISEKWYNGRGLWKCSSPTFPSPMRKPKVKQKLTERMLHADGFIFDSDVPLDSRAEIELIKQQLNEFKYTLNNRLYQLRQKRNWKLNWLLQKICDGDETIVWTDKSSELKTLRRQLIEFNRMLNEQDKSRIETDILSRGNTATEIPTGYHWSSKKSAEYDRWAV